MKNLLIYVNPKGFDEESEKLVKIQIDNSLELGWKNDDIILVTDFPYEYREIKAFVVTKGYYGFHTALSKVTTIIHLFEMNFFKNNELYWCHDLDAFQLEPISEKELGLSNLDAGFNDYCRVPQWQLGSFFFKKTARDIFETLVDKMNSLLPEYGEPNKNRPALDEYSLGLITNSNLNNINSRIKRMNGTYDFGLRRIDYCYEKADKPLKVIHFHPNSKLLNTLAIAMYGKNRIGKPLLNSRLINIFKNYGYS